MTDVTKYLDTYLSKVLRAIKLGILINGYYLSNKLTGLYVKPTIPNISGDVHLYDLEGNYLKSYKTKELLKQDGFDLYSINRAIKQNQTYKNYSWARRDKLEKVASKKETVRLNKKIGLYDVEGHLLKILNVSEAKKEFPNVYKVLRGQAKHCQGYIFKYIE